MANILDFLGFNNNNNSPYGGVDSFNTGYQSIMNNPGLNAEQQWSAVSGLKDNFYPVGGTPDVSGAAGGAGAGPGGTAGFDIGAWGQGLGGLGALWAAYNQFRQGNQMEDLLDFNKERYQRDRATQLEHYNNRVAQKAANHARYLGRPVDQGYIQRNTLRT